MLLLGIGIALIRNRWVGNRCRRSILVQLLRGHGQSSGNGRNRGLLLISCIVATIISIRAIRDDIILGLLGRTNLDNSLKLPPGTGKHFFDLPGRSVRVRTGHLPQRLRPVLLLGSRLDILIGVSGILDGVLAIVVIDHHLTPSPTRIGAGFATSISFVVIDVDGMATLDGPV